jgi:Domain of unknown function (DUF4375)
MDEALRQRAGTLLQERWGQLGVEGLLPEERAYVLLWELHAEVSNGTFDQYLGNSSGDHAEEVLATLARLGSVRLAGILRRVLGALPGGWCADQDEREERVAAVPNRWDVFRELTDEYYAAIEAEAAVGERAIEEVAAAYQREGLLN